MSCFSGLMNEYQYLSIDRFDGVNLSSSAYFLSHCHADHLIGLDSETFNARIASRDDIYLYCSDVTKSLLLADKRYAHLRRHVCGLPIEDPKIIESVADDGTAYLVTVTLLPAAHCPGSVMFFFEGDDGDVLYTGDFRLPKGSAKRMRNLHSSSGAKKSIRSVYVDTTFCTNSSYFIPSREDCLEGLKEVIRDWLKKDRLNAIRLNLSAKYGYEYLFRAFHKEFGTKIYCLRKGMYNCLPDTYKILTADAKYAKIFACFKKESLNKHWKDAEGEEKFPVPEKKNILTITLSTMYFTYAALPHEIYRRVGKNHYRFCFSFHSSYGEVCDFVKYLEPENVYANVRRRNGPSLEEVANHLVSECGLERKSRKSVSPSPSCRSSIRKTVQSTTRNAKMNSRKRVLSFSSTDDQDSQELCEKFLSKAKKKDNELTEREQYVSEKSKLCNSSELIISEKDFNVSSSPGNKPPRQSDIDALHIKIALNYDLSPVPQ